LIQLFATTFLQSKRKLMAEKKAHPFILSDESENDYGIYVITEGIETEDFLANPIMLLAHDQKIVLGKWSNVRKENAQLIADSDFDTEDPEAKKWSDKVDRGYVKGASAWIEIKELRMDVPDLEGKLTATKSILREGSIAPVPSNRKTLLLTYKGEELTKETCLKLSSELKPKTIMNKLLLFLVSSLKMAAGTSEDEALVKLQNIVADNEKMKTENEKLDAENKALKLTRNTELVKGAVKENKIKAEDEATYMTLANDNYETAKKILDGFKPHVTLASKVNETAVAGGEKDKYDGWDIDRFMKEDPKELARIRKEENERFKKLFNAKNWQSK
jgi:hypothetical protein